MFSRGSAHAESTTNLWIAHLRQTNMERTASQGLARQQRLHATLHGPRRQSRDGGPDRRPHVRRRRVHCVAAWYLLGHDSLTLYNQLRSTKKPHPNCHHVTRLAVGQGLGRSTASYIFSIERRKGLMLYVAHISPTHEAHYDSSPSFSSTDRRCDDDRNMRLAAARAESNTDPASQRKQHRRAVKREEAN